MPLQFERRAPWIRIKRTPAITVCIPAFKAVDFIERTLSSVADQSCQDLQILISNDGGYDARRLNRVAGKYRAKVIHQRTHLNWVGNTNALIAKVDTPYFCILPHDDALYPDYLADLLGVLESDPTVASAFSDLSYLFPAPRIGELVPGSSVLGERKERIASVLRTGYNGHCYRALIRVPRDKRSLYLKDNPHFHYGSDTVWILQQAVLGQMVCIHKPLYKKYITDRNTHHTWWKQPADQIAKAWLTHCRDMAGVAMQAAQSKADAEEYCAIAAERYLQLYKTDTPGFPPWIGVALRETWGPDAEPHLTAEFYRGLPNQSFP